MEREDRNLAFMLRYENIAWYEDGKVRILDRRIYPGEVSFVTCTRHEEVRDAVRDMVTQSAGPYTAVGMAMALAAKEAMDRGGNMEEYLKKASLLISSARPTTRKRMAAITDSCIPVALEAIENGERADYAIRRHIVELNDRRYGKIRRISEYLADRIVII